MAGHTFTAQLWDYEPDQPSSWHFVTLPVELADHLRAQAGPREGFGSIRVEARIGATAWRTSLFPATASGLLLLPVKKQVRIAEGLEPGSSCHVTVTLA